MMSGRRLSIRGGAGLGDALYVQAVARHLVKQGNVLEVCTRWPDVFRPLDGKVTFAPFRRDRIDRLAHYSLRRGIRETDQFVDCCLQAGITEKVELRLDWLPLNVEMVSDLRRRSPVVLVPLPRSPMDRKDGLGSELLPDCRLIQRAIDRLKAQGAFVVQVGAGKPLDRFEGIDLDLANRTSVTDLLDAAYAADVFLGWPSFFVPLAESLGKPSLLVWSCRGLKSSHEVINRLKPHKVLHAPSSRFVIDDCSERELAEAVDALCQQVGCSAAA